MYLEDEEAIPHQQNSARGRYKNRGFDDDDEDEGNDDNLKMEFDPRRLKEMLQLDPATREKLNKLK